MLPIFLFFFKYLSIFPPRLKGKFHLLFGRDLLPFPDNRFGLKISLQELETYSHLSIQIK